MPAFNSGSLGVYVVVGSRADGAYEKTARRQCQQSSKTTAGRPEA